MCHPKTGWLLVLRETLESFSKAATEYICEHCYFCKNCRACSLNSSLTKELKRVKFKSENKKMHWWRIQFIEGDQLVLSKNQ